MLADELATSLRGRGRAVIRASIEGFLRPRIERYRRGPESAQGCYEDSFDYDRLRVELLRPLGESGSRLYRTEIYDRRTDLLVDYRAAGGKRGCDPPLRRGVPAAARAGRRLGLPRLHHASPPKRSSAARASATRRCTDHPMMPSGGSAPGTCRPSGTTAGRSGRPSSPTSCSRTTTRPGLSCSCGAETSALRGHDLRHGPPRPRGASARHD